MLNDNPCFVTSLILCFRITGLFFCISKSNAYSSWVCPSVELFTTTGLFVVICPYNIAIVAPRPNIPLACFSPNFEPYNTVPKARGTCFASIPGPLSFTVKIYDLGSCFSGSNAFMDI